MTPAFLSRYSGDILSAGIAVLWGCWNLVGRSFDLVPSLRAAGRLFGASRGQVECALAVILFFGAAAQLIGVYRNLDRLRIAGALAGFSVFFVAFLSTIATLFFDPAAPAFLGLSLGYFVLAALVTIRAR